MDAITTFAMSIEEPLIRSAGMLLNDTLIYAALMLAILLIGEGRNEKRAKVLLAFAIAALLALGAKEYLALERPCADGGWCPEGYSFPSAHAAIAFTLMMAFLNKKAYPLFLLLALFVCFTRLNLGVHTFYDVAAALPIAMLSYYIADIIWERYRP